MYYELVKDFTEFGDKLPKGTAVQRWMTGQYEKLDGRGDYAIPNAYLKEIEIKIFKVCGWNAKCPKGKGVLQIGCQTLTAKQLRKYLENYNPKKVHQTVVFNGRHIADYETRFVYYGSSILKSKLRKILAYMEGQDEPKK